MLVDYVILCGLLNFHKMMGVLFPWTILRPGLFCKFSRFVGAARMRCSRAAEVRAICVFSGVCVESVVGYILVIVLLWPCRLAAL